MSTSLSLLEFAGRGQSMLTGVTVSDCYSRDYVKDFGKVYPAVWVLAQRMRRGAGGLNDIGGGYSGMERQNFTTEIVLRAVVQRYAAGQTDVGVALNTLVDQVIEAFIGWMPTNSGTPLVVVSRQDGPASESVAFADVVFATTITHTRAS
jgi:hypothetical protein